MSHHILRQLVSRQVFDVLMLRVDDVSELPAVNVLFKHPHLHGGGKALQWPGIISNDLCDGWAPASKAKEVSSQTLQRTSEISGTDHLEDLGDLDIYRTFLHHVLLFPHVTWQTEVLSVVTMIVIL